MTYESYANFARFDWSSKNRCYLSARFRAEAEAVLQDSDTKVPKLAMKPSAEVYVAFNPIALVRYYAYFVAHTQIRHCMGQSANIFAPFLRFNLQAIVGASNENCKNVQYLF